jgi:hypothetical protein
MNLNCSFRFVASASQATMKSKADGTVWAVASVHTVSGAGEHGLPGKTPVQRANFKQECPGLSSGTHAMRVYGRASSSKIGGGAPRGCSVLRSRVGVFETHESLLCLTVVCAVVEAVFVVVVRVRYVFL